jgi:hypothetical protein
MSKQDEILNQLKELGYSSPAGIHWDRLRKTIIHYAENPSSEKLPNPLILGGSIASHAHNHNRLAEQLEWAKRHNCLDEAITSPHLLLKDRSKWNISDGNDWYDEHPWVTDGFK